MREYRIPTIDDFEIGTQYEMKEGFTDGTVKTQEDYDNAKWIPMIIISDHELPYIERALTGRNAQKGLCGIRIIV